MATTMTIQKGATFAARFNVMPCRVIRDEGTGFNPEEIAALKDAGEDRNRGISLIRPRVDEIQYRNHATEIYVRMSGRQRP